MPEQRLRVASVCAGERWVIDTLYSSWMDLVLHRVDLIVALDYPRWLSLMRLLRRTAGRIVNREPVCNGNTETLRNVWSKDSIIAWHFRSFANKRTRIRTWAADPDGPPIVVLRGRADTRAWLARPTST